jgi:hypothetical protein
MGHGHVNPNPDGAKARCGGPGICADCSQEAATAGFHAAAGQPESVTCPSCGHQFTPDAPVRVTESTGTAAAVEATVNGSMSFADIAQAVQDALRARLKAEQGDGVWCWVGVTDLTATDVVYSPHIDGQECSELYQCSYTITETGEVTLGDTHEVVRTYAPAPGGEDDQPEPEATPVDEGTTEAEDRIYGRVVEALDDAPDGGRVFRVRIIAYGDSKNGRRYTEAVMSAAAPMYEGARAYDHHRTDEEMRSSTIAGLVGFYRNVEAESDGIYGDLHLLPGATHAAESLDATLAAQEAGLPPIVGVSHDVMGHYRQVVVGGRRLQEATAITRVNSADLVADPAAGGQATRMVAGGTADGPGTVPADKKEDNVPPTKEDILGALREATDEELKGVGLARAVEARPEGEDKPEPVQATEASAPKDGWMAKAMISQKVSDAGLPEAVVEGLVADLPDRITEADVDSRITGLKSMYATIERAGLAPSTASVQVTQEAREKKVAALDAFFDGRFSEGYRSFRQAWEDFTGYRPKSWDEDVNKRMMRESVGTGSYDSGDRLRMAEGELRLRESMDSSTWNLVLGDSITRRMVREYARPNLSAWRQIVSQVMPVNDFRQQRIDRVGGYGTLPAVNQGAPYQPLTSPPNEEASYQIGKRGGTEDITLEMIANDDVRAISNIPRKLGLAAAQTLYRFVFDMLATNVTCSYDSTALFHANHANTNTNALSQSALSAVRAAMRQQAAYGDSKDILSIVPQTLIVPSALEELAWQLANSAVAIPSTPAGPSDTPNIHSRMNQPIVVDYWTDPNDWFAVADPSMVPTIEVGFYLGREDPELFTQSDPSIGSMFDADKVTYKIRHIYSGTVVDHRGFYRNVA